MNSTRKGLMMDQLAEARRKVFQASLILAQLAIDTSGSPESDVFNDLLRQAYALKMAITNVQIEKGEL